jgi:hypothetical protein
MVNITELLGNNTTNMTSNATKTTNTTNTTLANTKKRELLEITKALT